VHLRLAFAARRGWSVRTELELIVADFQKMMAEALGKTVKTGRGLVTSRIPIDETLWRIEHGVFPVRWQRGRGSRGFW
jgi:hypothetical protein